MAYVLLFSIFVIATCGLIYELIAGTLASYLLGDSITQFSTVIGAFLFSMGVGSYLSKFVTKNLIALFIKVELLVGLFGGFSAAILFVSFEFVSYFRVLLYGIVFIIGVLVGFEIPILMRILQTKFDFRELVSKVFTFDYIGALFASILFPLLLVPHLGLIKTAFLFGIFNIIVGIWALYIFRNDIKLFKLYTKISCMILIILLFGFIFSEKILNISESKSYPDSIIYSKTTNYQRIVLTKSMKDYRLFLNKNLQFSSKDEYRYHESLVHIGLSSLHNPKSVLVLGGGDGLAIREILKYPTVTEIVLVELDSEMTKIFSKNKVLTNLNKNSLLSYKVKIINEDAFLWLKHNTKRFDFIVVDFPDPSNFSVGKLYTNSFYRLLKTAIAENGVGVIQSTSPYVAKKTFWCVNNTLKSVGFKTLPYHVYVPAFGDWGYFLIYNNNFYLTNNFPSDLKYINADVAKSLFVFSNDLLSDNKEINKLNNQILVKYFEEEWSEYVP